MGEGLGCSSTRKKSKMLADYDQVSCPALTQGTEEPFTRTAAASEAWVRVKGLQTDPLQNPQRN